MRLAPTADQRALAAAVRDLLAVECPPEAVRAAWADGAGRSGSRWAKLAELGVPGLIVPEEYGGLGGREPELVTVLEETGRAALPEPVVETAVAVGLVLDAGDRWLRDEWLPRVVAGQATLAVGLECAAYVADAHRAGLLLMQHGDEVHAVPPDAVTLTPQPSVDGARRLFRVAWLPAEGTRVASGDVGRAALGTARDRGALAVSAQLLGLAERMIAMAVQHARVRTQFGRPVGSHQAVQHRLADALAGVEFARPVVHRAACSLATGAATAGRDVSMAVCYAAPAALAAGRAALQVHGAIGYTAECDLHLWFKRALVLAGAWGEVGWHRARVAAEVLGGDGC